MLSYTEIDNLAAVEIVITGRVSAEEFDATAQQLERFIARHGRIRVLEVVRDFKGMNAASFWHDLRFSLRYLAHFSRCAIVTEAKWLSLWSAVAEPFLNCEVAYFGPDEEDSARDWLLWTESAAGAA